MAIEAVDMGFPTVVVAAFVVAVVPQDRVVEAEVVGFDEEDNYQVQYLVEEGEALLPTFL